MSLEFVTLFEKGKVTRSCKFCLENEGRIARVFSSEGSFHGHHGADGFDNLKHDQYANVAVWPGKNNVGLKQTEWVLCCPVHPQCGHGWREFYGPDFEFNDWYGSMDVDALIKKHEKKAS